MLESISDKFILKNISFRVIFINQDSEKSEKYVTDLNASNDENDLYYMLEITGIENFNLLGCYIYIDINKVR